jgi:biopolymer transport protein ExbB
MAIRDVKRSILWNMRLGVALALLAVPVSSFAADWWDSSWNFRKEITFDLSPTGADIAGTATDVPVLVRLHIGNFTYFGDTKADGSDLRFVAADDKTPLKFHIERYDPQSQMAFIWVLVPQLTGGAKTDKIYLYYGNAEASAAADAPGTYDAKQSLVYHFAEAVGSQPADSTGNKNNPTAATVELNPASLIGGGARFSGSTSISVPTSPSLRVVPAQGATLSVWVRFESPQSQAFLAALEGDGAEFVLGIDGSKAFARITGVNGAINLAQAQGELSAKAWHHLAVRAGDGRFTLFVDGVDAGSVDVEFKEIGGTFTVGASAKGANFFTGEMDELEFARGVRSADWIKAAARSQGLEAPLIAYGGDTQKDSGGVSYFAITLRNVTTDGWVVISVLAVMFVLSVVVMIGKATFLERVRRSNAEFLGEFHKQRDDLTALDRTVAPQNENEESAFEDSADSQLTTAMFGDQQQFGTSTLFRLYHHGAREMNRRLAGKAAGADRARVLSAQSIAAIRATMDASLTRMTQKLSAQMVLLTICISGGPFLGLLGTVVGVMITFAAIAASGEVNINAIAPGTAAALMATVAGLGVAIPCLFGYNFLNTRIKEITADMRVFVDEFVTQIAEQYS